MAKQDEEEINKLSRYFAITSNNDFWRLSEKELLDEEKTEILTSAFSSLYHWQQVGNDENKYLAYVAVARALSINNVPGLAVKFAQQSYDFFKNSDQLWITAFSHAILSHALLINGEHDRANKHYLQAKNIGDNLESEDKEIFDATFCLIPNPAK